MHKTKGVLSTRCPSVPVGLQEESCWPPSVLPAPRPSTPGLRWAGVVPLWASSPIFHDCHPFRLCGVETVSWGGGTKAGCFKPPCCGLQGVSDYVLGEATFLFSPIETCCATNHRANSQQIKLTAGVGSNCSARRRVHRPGRGGTTEKKLLFNTM